MAANDDTSWAGRETWFFGPRDLPAELVDRVATTLRPPPFFDDADDLSFFTRLVLASMSLSLCEKNRLLDALPTLSLFQVGELTRVFHDETEDFRKLDEPASIAALSAAAVFGAFCLAEFRGTGFDPESETLAIARMASEKQAKNPDTGRHLCRLKDIPAIVAHVYGESFVARRRAREAPRRPPGQDDMAAPPKHARIVI